MAKFRKKPVVVEAVRVQEVLQAAATHWRELPLWLRDAYSRGDVMFGIIGGDHILIRTLEGFHWAGPVDWIICGVKGELYPIKHEIFAATYEPVDGLGFL